VAHETGPRKRRYIQLVTDSRPKKAGHYGPAQSNREVRIIDPDTLGFRIYAKYHSPQHL